MYQYSMTQWIVGDEPIDKSFERLKKCGYDGIEFAAEPYSLDAAEMKKKLDLYQMKCTSLCGIFTEERDLTAPEGRAADQAVQYLKDSVDFAEIVGAPYMIVVPSPVGRKEPVKDRSCKEAWGNAISNIQKAADYAKLKGVKLVIEAINRYETYLVNNLTDALQFVKEVNHSEVGLMADIFHMSLEEKNIAASLRMISEYLLHVHIADNTREAAGLGSVDFKTVLYTLQDIGYEGSLTMEFLPRIANPYQASGLRTPTELMDDYAEQAINYMKIMENSVI